MIFFKIFSYRLVILALMVVIPSLSFSQTDSLWLGNWREAMVETCPYFFYCDSKTVSPKVLQEVSFTIKSCTGKSVAKTKKVQKNTISLLLNNAPDSLGSEGFIIKYDSVNNNTQVIAKTNAGLLYGVFEWQRRLHTGEKFTVFASVPKYDVRVLNHWDNLDGSVERGYAGKSIWFDGDSVSYRKDIVTYARANASIGINAIVINNVNASPEMLSAKILKGVKRIADIMRPYNIKVYLAVNFSTPSALGGLSTSDPLNDEVIAWWNKKVKEIYTLIPDFGGFLVKANSEGLPGPMDYGRTHSDGANMLAKALKPYNGIVMWRAFVYSPKGGDRAKQAYEEFMPLDGKFDDNVIIQIKNGPVDFQPREPFSPLFGALKKTQIMAEVQITQEYLGYSDHLCYLATMWKEFLDYPTYHNGMDVKATTLNQKLTAISGVANTGTMKNWCGYVFAQSNWYCFGRLAWNPELKSSDIAREWVLQSLSKNPDAVEKIVDIMQKSREAVVDYMMPLGFHHLFGWSDHYGPQPWCAIEGARADWMPSYYHKADKNGVGFNRAVSGSNAVEQYQEPLRTMYNDPKLCPQEYLLWFHHLPWDYVFDNGSTLWVNICEHYYRGAQRVDEFRKTWKTLVGKVYSPQYSEVEKKLEIQYDEAQWWRDACLLYFSNISGLTIPENLGSQKYHSVEECEQKRMKKAYVERQRD